MERLARRALAACAAALLVAVLVPAAASAASFNFFNVDGLGPAAGAGTEGPANKFPSSTSVSGLSGTLSKVTVTLLQLSSGSGDDIDALLVGPEGQEVMLMSDACGEALGFLNDYWTFDDAAASALPDAGPCSSNQAASFKPVNYAGNSPEPDQFGAGGGIEPPYGEALSDFAGTDPNGFWDLYLRDDNAGIVGFELHGWLLTLEVEPPAPQPPASGPPAPPAESGPPAPPATTPARHTGKRARALARCKKKKTKKARRRCRAKARKLPV